MKKSKWIQIVLVLVLGIVLGFMGAHSGLVPQKAYAASTATDTFAVFSGTTPAVNPTLVTGVGGQSVYVKAITITCSASAPVSLLDGSTVIMTIPCLANVPTTLGADFFMGGPNGSAGFGITAGHSLGLQQSSTSATLNCTVRYGQF